MGMIADVIIGADTFKVYALTAGAVVDASTYFNGQLGPNAVAWIAASADNRAKALVMAADWIDRAMRTRFTGTISVAGQPREWPRDGATCDGVPLPAASVPDKVALAEFWLAGALLVNAAQAAGTGTGSNIKMVKAGPAEVQFFTPTIGSSLDVRLPQPAMDYLLCLLKSDTSALSGVVSGVSDTTVFSSVAWARSEGF